MHTPLMLLLLLLLLMMMMMKGEGTLLALQGLVRDPAQQMRERQMPRARGRREQKREQEPQGQEQGQAQVVCECRAFYKQSYQTVVVHLDPHGLQTCQHMLDASIQTRGGGRGREDGAGPCRSDTWPRTRTWRQRAVLREKR